MIVENTIEKELELTEIWGVGQYALGMTWGDGHNTGIYPFSYLRELAGL
jgi:ATP-binding protein involved in chromosome partitioning